MKYVIGVDLGTSAVKAIVMNSFGEVMAEASYSYPLIQIRAGYSEQDPAEWFRQTARAIAGVMARFEGDPRDIEGISYSGQMHGLVLLDKNYQLLRPAILWNDTRTTPQCKTITKEFGAEILAIAKNEALEGFTLPKLLWVQEHEHDVFEQAAVFLLPKDYVRYWMTGKIHTDFSDAAGTLLLDVENKEWSTVILQKFHIPETMCPPLLESHGLAGTVRPDVAKEVGLSPETKVFAGGADNACGAIGAGILSSDKTLCSIGTSGVILSYETNKDTNYQGKLHFFNHGKIDSFYSMGVTLAAGQSLTWFKDTFAEHETFEELIDRIDEISAGSDGLIFTPYLFGERTPYPDAIIRGSFIGMNGSHRKVHFVRAVLEGITFSLNESIHLYRQKGKRVDTIISIGGGAKSDIWLQMQANIFNARVVKLKNEQGPGVGAAILAAYGAGWFPSLDECAHQFIEYSGEFYPQTDQVAQYQSLFEIYQMVYPHTKEINQKLVHFRA